MISGGRLTYTAQRLEASTAQDTLGLRSDVFSADATFRCDLRPVSATEQAYADGVTVRRSWEIRARWQRIVNIALTEVDRLLVDGRTMRITSILDLDGAGRVAVIQCEEVS
jgi:head-tail adaptor